MKLIIPIVLLITTLSCSIQAQEPSPGSGEERAIDFALSMGIGWNLGNQMDAYVNGVSAETAWGNPVAGEAVFKALEQAGFRTVRIPVTWMGHIGVAPTYTIEKAWLDRLAELVGWAHKYHLKVIINIHHDGFGAQTDAVLKGYHWLDLPKAAADEQTNIRIKQQLTMMWLQIGQRFKDEGDYLIFETMNEIQDGQWGQGANTRDGGAQYRVLNEWNQVCVSAIRAAGGENVHRYIGIPGYVANPTLTIEHLVMPEDETPNRIMIAVHSYDPWTFAGEATVNEWGHTGTDVVSKTDEQDYVNMLNRLYNRYVRVGIPVYFGEFGCVKRVKEKNEAYRLYYLRYVCKAMRDRHIPAIYWDNGSTKSGADGFGIINHATGRYLGNGEQVVQAMVGSWGNDDPAFTLQTIFNSAPEVK